MRILALSTALVAALSTMVLAQYRDSEYLEARELIEAYERDLEARRCGTQVRHRGKNTAQTALAYSHLVRPAPRPAAEPVANAEAQAVARGIYEAIFARDDPQPEAAPQEGGESQPPPARRRRRYRRGGRGFCRRGSPRYRRPSPPAEGGNEAAPEPEPTAAATRAYYDNLAFARRAWEDFASDIQARAPKRKGGRSASAPQDNSGSDTTVMASFF